MLSEGLQGSSWSNDGASRIRIHTCIESSLSLEIRYSNSLGYLCTRPTEPFLPSYIPVYTRKASRHVHSRYCCCRIHQLPSSSNGQFRFYVTTYAGIFPVNNTWCDTWEKYFERMMRETVDYESAVHKHDKDLIKLTEQLVAKIIPRLLRPLGTGGRKIKPCLVHGHFWHGNVATHSHFRKPMLLDPCALYAHNEGQCPDRLLVSRSWLTLPPACPEIQEQP